MREHNIILSLKFKNLCLHYDVDKVKREKPNDHSACVDGELPPAIPILGLAMLIVMVLSLFALYCKFQVLHRF